MDDMLFIFGVSNYYFDVTDYELPIKVVVEDDFVFPMIQGTQVEKAMKLKENKADDYTSLYYHSGKTEYTYYSVENVVDRSSTIKSSGIAVEINLRQDFRSTFIERKVYTFYDMLSQIGGVIGLIIPF